MREDRFSDTFRVNAYECDAENRMTPGAILRRAQQIAADHSASVGETPEVHEKTHSAFLLAKMAMELRAPIRAGMRIAIETIASAQQKSVFYRCTTLTDTATGEVLCAIDSRWVLVNTQTRHILRRPPEGFPVPYGEPPAFELPLDMVRAEGVPVAEETAAYTRCDVNHHLNNTFYADIILDHTPLERLACAAPARLVILYHHEIPMGTSFTLSRAGTGEDTWYFRGQENAEGKTCFEASLTLRP